VLRTATSAADFRRTPSHSPTYADIVKRPNPGSLVFESGVGSDARVRDDAAKLAVSSLTHLEVHSGVRSAR